MNADAHAQRHGHRQWPRPPTDRRPALAVLALLVAVLPLRGLAPLSGQELPLQSPLTTVARCAGAIPATGDLVIAATVIVPADAPADLGVGAFVADRHGRWFQRCGEGVLGPGRHRLRFPIDAASTLIAEPDRAAWTASAATLTAQAGLFFWSASGSRAVLAIDGLAVAAAEPGASPGVSAAKRVRPVLADLALDGFDARAQVARGATGERWTLSALPAPFPANPYDPAQFALDAVFTAPDGKELRVAGFARQPMRLSDRGDREESRCDGACRFEVRFRPRQPGCYRVRLETRWGAGGGEAGSAAASAAPLVTVLPDLEVSGAPWDQYARVDAADPRFFSVDGRFYWPVGLNLNATFDTRCRERMGTVLTPNRGTLTYLPRLERLAAAGGNAVEIWMSAWNLALEWRADWPGYAGLGRYSEANAARLDAILDAAWARGIRVNLVINNHGQASPREDREWKDNPYNQVHGGPLGEPYELFTSPLAAAAQQRLRRYLVARFADHPAILGWKLWSEVNLTAAGDTQRNRPRPGVPEASYDERRATLRRWHEQAAARWHELDIYGHGVTTHWSGDYHTPDRAITALPGLDYLCIDAYLNRPGDEGGTLADLVWNGTQDRNGGLGAAGKPLLVTEYGGTWLAGAKEELEAQLASAPWAGLMSGNGGAPMMWWFEWVDQGDRWESYGAITRFLAGEDLRGKDGHGAVLGGSSPSGRLWVRAWTKPGRMLGYVADARWLGNGSGPARHEHATVTIGTTVAAGAMEVEWWNADAGTVLSTERIEHGGGQLDVKVPAFSRHVGFKMRRVGR
jgi:hypothetical protein